jgi:type IV secretory pathway TraG/TraD family ATPase VirD4
VTSTIGADTPQSVQVIFARFLSNLIGQAEYEDPDLHQTIADQHAGGFQMRRQEKTAPLVMPSELQSLPDLSCLIRTNSSHGVWSQTRIPYCCREPRRAAFEPLPELMLPKDEQESTPGWAEESHAEASAAFIPPRPRPT